MATPDRDRALATALDSLGTALRARGTGQAVKVRQAAAVLRSRCWWLDDDEPLVLCVRCAEAFIDDGGCRDPQCPKGGA